MIKTTAGLPRPRKEDMVYDESREQELQKQEELKEQEAPLHMPSKPVPSASHVEGHNLDVITEDEELLLMAQPEDSPAGEGGPAACFILILSLCATLHSST